MKNLFAIFMIAVLLCLSLCACGGETKTDSLNSETGQNSGVWQNSGKQQSTGENSASLGDRALRLLSNPYDDSACNTENGYYYLTEEISKLRDGNYGIHLMYMDFATGKEIYLCSTAGCKHDSLDCPAVFSYDEFPTYTTILFVIGNHLYILSREYDDDGTMSQGFTIGDTKNMAESQPAVLYRTNLDGTERKKIYTFDSELTLEDKVVGNDRGIYVITKKLSVDKNNGMTYTTSSERKLVFLDFESLSISEICQMDFGDNISWHIFGCHKNDFILCGTDFGREISQDEKWNDDVYKELYQNSYQVYAVLEQNGGKPEEIVRQSNKYDNSLKIFGDCLYLSSDENQNIEEINMETRDKKILCILPQNFIMDILGDMLCCRAWNLSGDPIWYFVNTKTGEITSSPLVNLCNGWSLEFRCETASEVLFVYDYDATAYGDGSYEIHQYKHALISKNDLFSGKDNYRRIDMIGSGQ